MSDVNRQASGTSGNFLKMMLPQGKKKMISIRPEPIFTNQSDLESLDKMLIFPSKTGTPLSALISAKQELQFKNHNNAPSRNNSDLDAKSACND